MSEPTKPRVVGVIVATHGDLARSLVDAVETILGRRSRLHAAGFAPGADPPAYSRTLQGLVRRANRGAGVLILADVFGGTPGTVALSLARPEQVEVVTGVNLSMAVLAEELPAGLSLRDAGQRVLESGQAAIKAAGTLLTQT